MKSAIALLLALSSSTVFQDLPADPAKVELKMAVKTGMPGAVLKGKMLVTFSPGWHGYQNPPTHDFEIPLKMETKTKGVVLRVQYPKGTMKDFMGEKTAMYEGTVELPFTLVLPKTAGTVPVKFDVNYQQCNSQSCLPPEFVSVTEKVTVKKAPAKPATKRKP